MIQHYAPVQGRAVRKELVDAAYAVDAWAREEEQRRLRERNAIHVRQAALHAVRLLARLTPAQ